MTFFKHLYLVFLLLIFTSISLEIKSQVDSTYIQPFEQNFSIKMMVIQKAVFFEMESDKGAEYEYRTNNPVSVGFGFSWKGISLSYSYGFDFFRDKKRGKTISHDFQYHVYSKKFIYDIFFQKHKGFHNNERKEDKTYDVFSDVGMNLYGGSFQYIFNNKKLSYKAAFNQSERQIKSAGSFIIGTSVYYSKVRSDYTSLFREMESKHQNLQIGVQGGYIYTWAITKSWFLTGSTTIGMTIGNNYPRNFFSHKMQVFPLFDGRFAFGYNAKDWSIGLNTYINSIFIFYSDKENLSMNNLNFQMSYTKRFDWGTGDVALKKARKKLKI